MGSKCKVIKLAKGNREFCYWKTGINKLKLKVLNLYIYECGKIGIIYRYVYK